MQQNYNCFSLNSRFLKRVFDVFFSLIGILAFWWLIFFGWLLAKFSTGESGFFLQERVGQYGITFKVIKLQTMKTSTVIQTTVTSSKDPRITKIGAILRSSKIDELPQLINVLKGEMSFVGPRPDVPGYADKLEGDDRLILNLKPGITGPASIFYKNEEQILANQNDPETYNRQVIFPKKVEINKDYMKNYSFISDLKYIVKTFTG